VDSEVESLTVVVRFTFAGKVDVRTFREDNSYVVDVSSPDARSARRDGTVRSDELDEIGAELNGRRPAQPPPVEAPQTMPARSPPATAPPERGPPTPPPQREATAPAPQAPPNPAPAV